MYWLAAKPFNTLSRRNQPTEETYIGLEQIPTADEAANIADELLALVPF